VVTALALKHFSETNVEIVILETGLGGRLDATNAVESNVSVITPIDFDHEKWLGKTISGIATEKAGIINTGVSVVSAAQRSEAEEVIRTRASECSVPLEFVTKPYDETPIALAGSHQKQNAALAIAALRAARIDIDRSTIAQGLGRIQWPARFQRWDKRTIIDGAHNPAAARTLVETWREFFGDERATLILAVLSDKNLRGICEALMSAPQARKNWRKSYSRLRHHSPTPSLHLLAKRSILRRQNQTSFLSPAHYISPVKFLRTCAGNLPRSKNARNE
jgi:dihydrofolate synthase/folylpolyglutamate synthase